MSDEEYEFLKLEREICCTGNCFSCDIYERCNDKMFEILDYDHEGYRYQGVSE